MMLRTSVIGAALAAACLTAPAARADTESDIATLKRLVAEQQKRIEALERQLSNQQQTVQAAPVAPAPVVAAAPPAEPKTQVGGYGEILYHDYDKDETTDVARFVIGVGHRFDEQTRLVTELEVEHGFIENADGEAEGGEIEVEQAYVEHDWNRTFKTRFGLFIMPIGILNEFHEPPVFYGVDRNPVETFIIPSTFTDRGIRNIATFDNGLTFDFVVSSGLRAENEDPGEEFLIDHIKPEGESPARTPAFTGRIAWRGIPGLELSATGLYQSDGSQRQIANVGHASFMEAHAIYRAYGFDLRGLYVRYDIGGSAPKAVDRDKQDGGYVEASYKLMKQLGIFSRYNVWDNGGLGGDTEIKQTNVGLNYWLIPDFVIKGDVQWQSGASDRDGFNLGFGYQF
jgi:hypothetical protein